MLFASQERYHAKTDRPVASAGARPANFPFDPKIAVVVHNTVASIGYNITQISMSTHQGTHLDVPYHFYDDGKTVDQMPLDRFYGPAALVDLAPGTLPAGEDADHARDASRRTPPSFSRGRK